MAHGRPDFSPTAVDVVLRPEWAAKEGTDKEFSAEGINVAAYGLVEVEYTIPAGKTLVITNVSFYAGVNAGANSELNQFCRIRVKEVVTNTTRWVQGGNGGGQVSLNKPLVFDAGEAINCAIRNMSNHVVECGIFAAGYEF